MRMEAVDKHLIAAGGLPHIILVPLGDHQVPGVVRAHVQAGDHALRQALRMPCNAAWVVAPRNASTRAPPSTHHA